MNEVLTAAGLVLVALFAVLAYLFPLFVALALLGVAAEIVAKAWFKAKSHYESKRGRSTGE